MANTKLDSGTKSVSSNSESNLTTGASGPNVAGVFELVLDLVNLPASHVLEVRAYRMVLTGSTARVIQVWTFSGAPPTDQTIVVFPEVSNTLTDTDAVKFTVKLVQPTTGITTFNLPWAINNKADFSASTGPVYLSAGTGTGQLDFTSGVVKANTTQVSGTTQTAMDLNTIYTRLGAPAGASVSADIASVKTDTGTTIPGLIAALNNLSAATVKSQVVAALDTDTYAQPGTATPAATTTLTLMIRYLYKAFRNRSTQTASQYSLYNDDALTVDQKASFSDDGTTADRGEVATGP